MTLTKLLADLLPQAWSKDIENPLAKDRSGVAAILDTNRLVNVQIKARNTFKPLNFKRNTLKLR